MVIVASLVLHAACGPVVFETRPDANEPADAGDQDRGFADVDAREVDAMDATESAADAADAGADDARIPDAVDITVHVTSGEESASGVPVVFHDSFGRAVISTVTDQDGVATSTRADSTMVTIVELENVSSEPLLQTVAGLEAGDRIELTIGNSEAHAEPHLLEVMPPGPVTDAVKYELDVGCGNVPSTLDPNQTNRVPISRSSFCVGTSSTVAAMATAYDAKDRRIAFSLATVTISNTATTALILPAWSVSFADFEIETNAAPPQSYLLFSGLVQVQNGLELGPISVDGLSAGADTSRILQIPQLGLDRQLQVGVQFLDGSFSGLFEPTPRFGSSRSVDLSNELLPAVDLAAIGWPAADRPRITWTTARASAIDAVGIFFFCASGIGYQWTLLFPSSHTSTATTAIDLPELPETLSAARPRMDCANRAILELSEWDAVGNAAQTKMRSRSMSEQRRFQGLATERYRQSGDVAE